MRKTKIVATLGPASSDEKTILKMIEAGANVFRLNFSHGTQEEYFAMIDIINRSGKEVAIMLDTMGPEIRTGVLDAGVNLIPGRRIILTTEKILGNEKRISVSYDHLPQEVKPGNTILLADGLF